MALQGHQLGMSHSKDRKGHTSLNEGFGGFSVIKLCFRKPTHCFTLNMSDFTAVWSRIVLWYIVKNSSSWAKLSSSAQACPSTSSSQGIDPLSTNCLTCSISHFRNCSGSYYFLRSAREQARYMWDALFNYFLKYWCSLRNPRLLSCPSSLFLSPILPATTLWGSKARSPHTLASKNIQFFAALWHNL